ncbi:MAG: 2-oxo-4-hydroxy-4-carboxy-5-ureidoimidazoline decarboxylase [Myxococcota bacterium]
MKRYGLRELSEMSEPDFVSALGGVFEHSPWVAKSAFAERPFATLDALHSAMVNAVDEAGKDAQLRLIRAHPELASKAAVRKELTEHSNREQAGAGLTECSADEMARLQQLNRDYNAKFGFPFILAVKGHNRQSIIDNFARRLSSSRDVEMRECLTQIAKIASFRLQDLVDES